MFRRVVERQQHVFHAHQFHQRRRRGVRRRRGAVFHGEDIAKSLVCRREQRLFVRVLLLDIPSGLAQQMKILFQIGNDVMGKVAHRRLAVRVQRLLFLHRNAKRRERKRKVHRKFRLDHAIVLPPRLREQIEKSAFQLPRQRIFAHRLGIHVAIHAVEFHHDQGAVRLSIVERVPAFAQPVHLRLRRQFAHLLRETAQQSSFLCVHMAPYPSRPFACRRIFSSTTS